MAINCILAMTGAEIHANTAFPTKIGWMALHFSPYGTGLVDIPPPLPDGSLLILDDSTPIAGHDPQRVTEQLQDILESGDYCGLLLDFQRPDNPEAAEMVSHILAALPCPVAVSEPYAADLECPVFLPPVPMGKSTESYLLPWQGREIWLEAALGSCTVTVTEEGTLFAPLPAGTHPATKQRDTTLHCHYTVRPYADRVEFTLSRTREDLEALLAEAGQLGVMQAVGLWQELKDTSPFFSPHIPEQRA